ncbi:O-antigen ligase family protein [Tamlana sp. 2_MG-2023]|uniref:O-antigen ligase family protein n=1 Tax=unclassified Tamlana TaxID=2614803 RepID=UPI0026E42797|nr:MULTISPECIES: O-antigen ligase family protein [unclassified Tamlana]MDO6759754.1 O-antigen ligase family protein [Tamlana sp. 2_MG-2023]MDO6791377.1 O-antigen ligase family protein [Tamlana sp. 1_MG-2023]
MNKQTLLLAFLWATLVIAAFPILTFGLRSIATILWAVLGIVNYCVTPKLSIKKDSKKFLHFIIAMLPFLCLVVSLLYTQNIDYGLKRLTKMLPLLIFPIIFYLNRDVITKAFRDNILWCFSISVMILVFYQMGYTVYHLDYFLADLTETEIVRNRLSNQDVLNQDVVSGIKTRRYRSALLDLTDTHFTYQGLWIIFTVFILIKKAYMFIKRKNLKGYLLLVVSVLLTSWLFMISSRMPILAMFVAAFYVLFISRKIKLKYQIILLGASALFLVLAYLVFTPLRVRVNEIFDAKFDFPTETRTEYNYDSINVRHGIYACASHIVKDNLWLGVGIGDSQDVLNACYNEKIKAKIYTWQDYNTHNQYLFFAVASGVFSLLFYLLFLYLQHKEALKYKNGLYLYFIIVVALISLTENILSRSDGVMFFTFFSSLFLFNNRDIKLHDNY